MESSSVLISVLAVLAILVGSVFIFRGSYPVQGVLPGNLAGVVVLAFGTTMPELAIILHAAFGGVGAFSNFDPNAYETLRVLTTENFPTGVILGSCLANLLFASGISGMMFSPREEYEIENFTFWRDLPFLGAAIALVGAACIYRPELEKMPDMTTEKAGQTIGMVLIGAAFVYLLVVFITQVMSRAKEPAPGPNVDNPNVLTALFTVLCGAAALGLGVYILSFEAPRTVEFLTKWHVSLQAFPVLENDRAVYTAFGLLFVGFAVALPEVISTLLAKLRGDSTPVAGNLIGASIFNLLGVLGLGLLLSGGSMIKGLSQTFIRYDLAFLALSWLLLFIFLRTDKRLKPIEGLILFALYCGYWAWRINHLTLT